MHIFLVASIYIFKRVTSFLPINIYIYLEKELTFIYNLILKILKGERK